MIVESNVVLTNSQPFLQTTGQPPPPSWQTPQEQLSSSQQHHQLQQQQQIHQQQSYVSPDLLLTQSTHSVLNSLSAPPSERGYSTGGSCSLMDSSASPRAANVGTDSDGACVAAAATAAALGACAGSSFGPLRVELPDDQESFNLKVGCLAPENEDQQPWRSNEEGAKERSCCFDTDDIMAGEDTRAEKYIMDIPYSVLLCIYQSLDADKGWEKLAAETGYTFDKIRLLELEGSRSQGSPSRSLLWELSSRNTTVRQLYGYFHALSRYREMKILEDYVHSPSNPSFVDYGLRGLPDVPVDASDSLKGLKSPVSKKSTTTTTSSDNNSNMHCNSVNFNQQMANSDVNISLKCQQTDKYYPGKQMPFLSPSPPTSSPGSLGGAESAKKNPSSIAAPVMKPSSPGAQGMMGVSNVNLVQNMLRQIPGGASNPSSSSSSSSSSSGLAHAQSQYQPSSSTSSPSSSTPQLSESPFSSSVSSLPGLESTFDVQMAFMGSACFSYSEVLQATNGFSEDNKLGEGAFGTVYYGVLRKNKCAVKKLTEAGGEESVVERSTQIKRELTSLLKFRHENIVTLYGYAVDGDSLCLIYQYMPNGSLEDRLLCRKNTQPLVWSQRLNIMVGACQGLNFLHTMGEQPLIHGDIKSANILLDKHMEAKLGDLGQAQQANGREGAGGSGKMSGRLTHITRAHASTKLYGTRAYQPREVQTGSRPSTKSDVFSMGVVLLEVFSGEKAFDERREGEKFLADYFRSLKGESGDDECLSKQDRRAGECPREVCLAILSLADQCTGHLKRQRPDSSKLLQKMTEVEDLYLQKTGNKIMGTDSLPGSEHSCHMSHCSTPGASVPNLSGAPPPPNHHNLRPPPHSSSLPPPPSHPCKPSNNFNVNEDWPSEKHYAMHLHHEKPDNCLTVNVGSGASAWPEITSHPQDGQSPASSSGRSPIDYFQKGQPLPPAFRLQQAYDSQTEREKKRISRLSQCRETRELAWCNAEGRTTEVLPQSDPAKLAVLEQFDQDNLHCEEKDSNSFQSDPKKLAALKQFDNQLHGHEEGAQDQPQEAFSQENNLASNPAKLAQLRLFDESSLKVSEDGSRQGEDDRPALASDPRKLAALTRFDAENYAPGAAAPSSLSPDTASDPRKLAALMHFDATNCPQPAPQMLCQSSQMSGQCPMFGQPPIQDPSFPVSELDYIVVTSQREALEACASLSQQSQHSLTSQPSLSTSHQPDPVTSPVFSAEFCQPQSGQASAAAAARERQDPASDGIASDETLLRRQKNFFDQYYKALEEMDGEEEEEEDGGDENEDYEDVNTVEFENVGYPASAAPASGSGEMCSPCVQEQVAVGLRDGHYHPVPTEQDESVLNYFKQRQHHYEKTFSKPQLSHC